MRTLNSRGILRSGLSLAPTLWLVLVMAAPASAQRDETCFAFWESMGAAHLDLDRLAALSGEAPPTSQAIQRAGEAIVRRCPPGPAPNDARAARAGRPGSDGPQFGLLPAVAITQFNTRYPRPQRDGLRWAGRGSSTGITAGAHARWGPVSAALAPVFAAHDNAAFPTHEVTVPGLSRWGSFYHAGTIDAPQRFGRDGAFWLHPGQSYIRVDAYGAAAGVSTETLRWGPGRRNPLLMSGTAPGFPHVFLGTGEPADIGIGRLEVEAVWGRLEESAYFDTIPDNDHRLLAGIVVAFSPGNTGLTLGAARIFSRYIPPGGLSLGELILGPYVDVRENPSGTVSEADNQLLSVFLRWAFPAVGFEVYGEYARDDHWEDFRDLLMEPDHSRAYMLGLQKVFALGGAGRALRVAAEMANLNASPTWQSGRPMPSFYTHSQVRQGHTHRGQLLGAPIGTGSDAQYVAADYLTPRMMLGLYLERVRYDNDAYYRHLRYPYNYSGHDAELTLALRGAAFLSAVQVMGEIGFSGRHNPGFVGLPGALDTTLKGNVSLILGLAWVPGGGRSGP